MPGVRSARHACRTASLSGLGPYQRVDVRKPEGMAQKGAGRGGSYPFYMNGPHHSKLHEHMPRYERKQGCVPQSVSHAGAWIQNVEKEEKLHELSEISYAAKQPVVTGPVRAQYLTEQQRNSRREYRNMKKQLTLEKRLRLAMSDEIAALVRLPRRNTAQHIRT